MWLTGAVVCLHSTPRIQCSLMLAMDGCNNLMLIRQSVISYRRSTNVTDKFISATKNWKTEANLAENGWGWSLRPLNFGLVTSRRRAMDRPAWRLLVDAATSSWHAPERQKEREAQLPYLAPVYEPWGLGDPQTRAKPLFFRQKLNFSGRSSRQKWKKYFFVFIKRKIECIPSSEIKCPESGIFSTNYWLGLVGQSTVARLHGRCRKIFRAKMAWPPRKHWPIRLCMKGIWSLNCLLQSPAG